MVSTGTDCEVVNLADGIFHGLHQRVEIHNDILVALCLCFGMVTLFCINVDAHYEHCVNTTLLSCWCSTNLATWITWIIHLLTCIYIGMAPKCPLTQIHSRPVRIKLLVSRSLVTTCYSCRLFIELVVKTTTYNFQGRKPEITKTEDSGNIITLD